MSQQQQTKAQVEKKSKAGVTFDSVGTGKLDEGAIPNDSYKSHYLFDGDTKSDSSYPVVSADGTLKRGNVESAYQLGARGGVSEDTLHSKLKKLNSEFDNPPIDFEESAKFTKHVEIAKVDTDRNVVVGVAMEPNAVDSQGDFERPETIRRLSEGYMERLATGDSQSGVMHATFPTQNALSHVENRVLGTAEEIGSTEYPSGTWQIGVKVRDETLQNLINSGTLSGFSIGGYIHDATTHDPETLPDDVRIDDDLHDSAAEAGESIREITDATIEEISLVDYPAVPSAQIQTAKGDDLAKAADELTHSVDTATEYLVGRGHDKTHARELAEFLNREKSATADDGGSWLTRAKRFFTPESGGSGGTSGPPRESVEKGATLSEENLTRGMAIHDIALSLLGTEIDHGRTTFASDSSFDFAGVAFQQPEDSSGSGSVFNAQNDDDTGGIPSDAGGDSGLTQFMNSDEFEDVLKDIQTTQEELNERMDALEPEESDGAGGEKSDPDGGDEPDRVDELAAQVESLAEATKQTNELVNRMADARGVTQQADVSANTEPDEKTDGEGAALDDLGKLLG